METAQKIYDAGEVLLQATCISIQLNKEVSHLLPEHKAFRGRRESLANMVRKGTTFKPTRGIPNWFEIVVDAGHKIFVEVPETLGAVLCAKR